MDTSVWIDHLKGEATALGDLLVREAAILHPFVLGELLLGGLSREAARDLSDVTSIMPVPPAEAAAAIGWFKLAGTGVGYVDAHLIISTKLLQNGRLLTRDRKLHAQAERLGVAADLV